jgi:hypothetical protein
VCICAIAKEPWQVLKFFARERERGDGVGRERERKCSIGNATGQVMYV